MWLNLLWTVTLGAAAMLAGNFASAHEGDGWEERWEREHEKKGKGKSRRKHHDDGHYVFYYVPRQPVAPASVPECARPLPQAPQASAKKADAFPKESRRERALAGERQREILEKELATEQGLLELARRELGDQRARIDRDAGDASALGPYRENVELHERNVAALRRELGHLKR